jgi:GntR family transcriptional regulator, rspAB operon transcriptional repressor
MRWRPARSGRGKHVELAALTTERLTDTVYGLLRERILSGVFRPGEKLNVDLLAQQLNVSQTPIKGALALLAAEGLVEVQPRRGTFVTAISEREITEVLAIRAALEALAAETIVDHATAADVDALKTMVREIAEATDVDLHFRKNSDFHQRLVELSGNQKLAELYRQLHAHIHIALIHSRSTTWRARAASEAEEHQAILNALERRDRAALKAAIKRHLDRSRTSLVSDIGSQARGNGRR